MIAAIGERIAVIRLEAMLIVAMNEFYNGVRHLCAAR